MEQSDSLHLQEKEDLLLKDFSDARNLKFPELQLTFRKLQYDDFDKGFIEVLSCLTVTGDVTKEQFAERFRKLELADSNFYKIIVVIDENTEKIVGVGTALLEFKFIRNLGVCGHIEDLSVQSEYSGKLIGLNIVYLLKEICKINQCYKVILDCTNDLTNFYKKNEFYEKGVQMAWYNSEVIECKSTTYNPPSSFTNI